jgi:riboflavin transporter FmnP
MKRKSSEIISRMSTIALLSALGFILMAYARIAYPFAPFLQIEFSDTVILIGYALYGFGGGLSVAIIKTCLDLLVHGLSGIYGIGNITALFASLIYVLGLFLTSHVMKLFKKGFKFRLVAYLLIVLIVATILTLVNYIFVTPTYMAGEFTTCFNSEVVESIKKSYAQFGGTYFGIIFTLYFPFNLIKGAGVCFIYEILFNRIIFVLMQKSPLMKKYFIGPGFKKEKEEEKEISTQEAEDILFNNKDE